MTDYPKRLIEVDLPIREISLFSRKEKNMRKNHPWQLHIWWARRPWGACRAVTLASLLLDPADPKCPESFQIELSKVLDDMGLGPRDKNPEDLRKALLKFVWLYSSWENGNSTLFTNAARRLVAAAMDGQPISLDSFSGFGAFPAEAGRIGCESIAGELNPVALMCLKIMLEYAPKYQDALLDLYEKSSEYLRREAHRQLFKYYPEHEAKTPIAWLWARTVQCEGPGCGARIPMISQTLIAKGNKKTWIHIHGDQTTRDIQINVQSGNVAPKDLWVTAGGGHATCPLCGFTTDKKSVKRQGKEGKMSHRLYGVALTKGKRAGKEYITATQEDIDAFESAVKASNSIFVPERFPFHDPRAFTAGLYGIKTWGDLFSPRQKLALQTLGEILQGFHQRMLKDAVPTDLARAVTTTLAAAISNIVHYNTNMAAWLEEHVVSTFITGNAIAMRWDWAEANPLSEEYAGGLDYSLKQGLGAIRACMNLKAACTVIPANATQLPFPDDSIDLFASDPPYYDVVPYADLSDLCYVWLRRYLRDIQPDLFLEELTPKQEQIVVNPYSVADGRGDQTHQYYQERMTAAFANARRALKPSGIGCIVFAHKGTAAWESIINYCLYT
jgi:adenine-specific DNA methylase